jgi:hypothetical protein
MLTLYTAEQVNSFAPFRQTWTAIAIVPKSIPPEKISTLKDVESFGGIVFKGRGAGR